MTKAGKFRVLLAIALFCWKSANAADNTERSQFIVFGTLVEVTISGSDTSASRRAMDALEAMFRDLHTRLHPWLPGPLADLNTAIEMGRPINVDPVLRELITKSRALYLCSDGLFNPAIGRLIEAWGFHQPASEWKPPAPQHIAVLVAAHPGMSDLTTVGKRVSSDNRTVKLDFGAIAKGYAVAAGLLKLRDEGVTAAMINAGGDLGVIGKAAENQAWRAGIENPFGENTIADIDLNDGEFLATSGSYERFHRYHGKKYTHLINPLSGKPENFWASVSVLAQDGSLADAAATALTLSDKKNWQYIAQKMGVDQVMLIDVHGGVYLTPAMRQRLQFADVRANLLN